jgi:putative membrane protein
MVQFLLRFIISAIVVGLILYFVPTYVDKLGNPHGFGWGTIIWVTIVLGILNALLGPILRLVSAPITWVTMGVFGVVINWILFALTVWIVPNVRAAHWYTNLIAAIILTLVATGVQQLWKTTSEQGAVA